MPRPEGQELRLSISDAAIIATSSAFPGSPTRISADSNVLRSSY